MTAQTYRAATLRSILGGARRSPGRSRVVAPTRLPPGPPNAKVIFYTDSGRWFLLQHAGKRLARLTRPAGPAGPPTACSERLPGGFTAVFLRVRRSAQRPALSGFCFIRSD